VQVLLGSTQGSRRSNGEVMSKELIERPNSTKDLVERQTAPKLHKTELVHGAYYRGQCRNATVARWNGEKQKFIHFRTKFGNVFLEEICCPEDDQVWDVFYAEEVIEPQDVTKAILFGGE
jgi:hypothetical protein